jgi:biotin carboxyl carrier protein
LPQPQPERDPAARVADHAEIRRLADDLLPALIAKLGASGLGELEVREDRWKVRLRRPISASGDPSDGRSRRASERRSRGIHAGPAAAIDGARAAIDGARAGGDRARSGAAVPAAPSAAGPSRVPRSFNPGTPTNGAGPSLAAVGPGRAAAAPASDPSIATSPAVGLYRPRSDLRAGTRLRAGDAIGSVDVLGIPQEVVAPVDGIVGASLAESGDAVEYGQALLRIEFAPSGEPAADAAGA